MVENGTPSTMRYRCMHNQRSLTPAKYKSAVHHEKWQTWRASQRSSEIGTLILREISDGVAVILYTVDVRCSDPNCRIR